MLFGNILLCFLETYIYAFLRNSSKKIPCVQGRLELASVFILASCIIIIRILGCCVGSVSYVRIVPK